MKTILAIAAVVAVAVVAGFGAAYYVSHRPAEAAANVAASRKAEMPQNPAKTAQTAKHHHRDWPGPIIVTGTVKPEEVVEVGAQVNGMIVSVGTDRNDPNKPLDQGSIVHKGEVLAQIDPTIYKAQVDYAEASLAKAKFDLQQLLAPAPNRNRSGSGRRIFCRKRPSPTPTTIWPPPIVKRRPTASAVATPPYSSAKPACKWRKPISATRSSLRRSTA